uniref:DNA ligase (ATP) n=1 Tax=Percolomonas cosmopolitus TaxID=63605 RepID=A0A7S1KS15_9EUKA
MPQKVKKSSSADKSGEFWKFTLCCRDVERESSLTLKEQIINTYLENEECDMFLAANFLLCKEDLRVFHMSDKKLVSVASEAFNADFQEMRDHLDEGDVSETLSVFLDNTGNALSRSSLTLKKVDDFLEKLTKLTKAEDQENAFAQFCNQKITMIDMLWVTRLIKKDLRIGAGSRTVLNAVHEDAYEMWKNTADLKYVVDKVQGKETDDSQAAKGSTIEILGEFDLSDSDGDDDDRLTTHDKEQKVLKQNDAMKDVEEVIVEATTTTVTGSDATTTTTTTTVTTTTAVIVDEDELQEDGRKRKKTTQPASSRPAKRAKMTAQIRLGKPVKPQLAKAVKTFQEAIKRCPNGMFADLKVDGERLQIHKDGDKFQYWSRNLRPVTEYKIKDVKEFIEQSTTANQVILDGEITMVSTKTGEALPFGALGKHKRQQYGNEDECVVAIFLFDILFYEGKSLLDMPLIKRRRLLKRIITPIEHRIIICDTQLIDGPLDERESILEDRMMEMMAKNYEGLVIKDINSVYEPKARHWLKMKRMNLDGMADTVDACVVGGYWGTGRMAGTIAVFLVAVRDPSDDTYWSICKVGNGFDDDTINELTEYFEPKMTKIQGNYSAVPDWLHTDRTHVPDLILNDPKDTKIFEVAGAEFSESRYHPCGISIRFPHALRIRDDKDVNTMTTVDNLKHLYEESKKTSSVKKLKDRRQGGVATTATATATRPTTSRSRTTASTTSTAPKTKRQKREPQPRVEEEDDEEDEEDVPDVEEEDTEFVDPNAPASGFIWQYYDNGWADYQVEASECVEEVFQDWSINARNYDIRSVKSGAWEYMIDFTNMTQTNVTHENHTVRRIRRVKWT